MLHQVIMKSLYAYLLLAIIAFFVAVVIKVIVSLFNRAAEKTEVSPKASAQVATSVKPPPASTVIKGLPAHHLVAITAAAQMVAGGRVVRIDEAEEIKNKNWTTIGRSQHLASHDIRR
ncbi:MAG: hypothetical protein HQL77_18545 [Magnetococcales bacterium]|nr:hypothetical protein [Magnetococcales bacterium]